MQSILNLSKTNKLILAIFAFLAVLAFGSGRVHAATLNVSGGCTLPIAINSVNAGANQSGCTASGSYATNDTINLPAGTITLTANLPVMNESVVIHGAGMNQTTIDGAGQYFIFEYSGSGDLTITDLKATNFARNAIYSHDPNLTLSNVVVDGAGSVPIGNDLNAVEVNNNSANTITVDVSNLYVHNFNSSAAELAALVLKQEGTGTINANFQGITIADVHSTGVGNYLRGFSMYIQRTGGNINATITNTTVDDITGDDLVLPFSSLSTTGEDDAISVINTLVQNITITGMRGHAATGNYTSVESAAFYAGTYAPDDGSVATVNVDVTNSLMADNLNDGVSSNCFAGDFTVLANGDGVGSANINSLGYNISDDNSCTGFTEPGDQQNVGNIISTLGPLQNNGGYVPTRALLAGSPAISAGGAVLGVTTDARGVARTGYYSVGAYQYVLADVTASPATATAPNTGIGTTTLLLNVLASMLGIGLLAYVFRKQQRSN